MGLQPRALADLSHRPELPYALTIEGTVLRACHGVSTACHRERRSLRRGDDRLFHIKFYRSCLPPFGVRLGPHRLYLTQDGVIPIDREAFVKQLGVVEERSHGSGLLDESCALRS